MLTFIKKKGFLALTLLALFTGLSGLQKAVACHFAAADISVRYIGPGADGCTGTTEYKYEVELIIYYACLTCQGSGGTVATVQYTSESAVADGLPTPSGSLTVTDPVTDIDTVHQLCDIYDDSNSCKTNMRTASRYPAFKIRKHVGTVTLPYARTDWRFYWSGSARSNSNIDLNNPQCYNLYVEAGLNNMLKYNNSTIKFLTNPLPYICVNQPTTYLNGPWDPNGDSINVEVQPPHNGFNQPCNYTAPSTHANPIASSTGFNLNKSNGTANFTPSATGQYVLAFRGEDYLPGTTVRMSYVYRDVQVSVLPCTEPPPNIDSLKQAIVSIKEGTVVNDKVLACPGSNLAFDVNSKSADPTHNVYMYANVAFLGGSTFTVSGQGTGSVTGTFSWTPTASHIGKHALIIESKDSSCLASQPIVLINYRVINIVVLNGLDAGPDRPVCELNPDSVQLYVYGTEELNTITWDVNGGPAYGLSDDKIHNPRALPPYTTDYVISTPDLAGACRNKDTVQVFIDETNKVTITPKNPTNPDNALVLCRPNYVQLEAILEGRPPKNNVGCGISSPTLCSSQLTGVVFGSLAFGGTFNDTVGDESPIFFSNVKTTRMQHLIRKEEMQEAKIYSSTIRSLSLETKGMTAPTLEYRNVRILMKCTDKEQLNEGDGFENFGLTQVFSAASMTFPDGVHTFPFSLPYSWDTTKNLIVQICFSDNPAVDTSVCGASPGAPPVIKFVSTSYKSGLMLGAPDTLTQTVCGIDKSPNLKSTYTRPRFTFNYCEAKPLDFIVTWTNGEYLSDSTILQPLAYVPKTSRFVVQTVGRSSCLMRDTLDIYVPDNDYRIEPKDTSVCYGDKTPFTIYGGHYFKWYEYENGQYILPGNMENPRKGHTFVSPTKTTDYRIVVSDSVYCYDTLSAHVTILPLPDVRILNEDDTTVKYGQSFQLLASGARYYNWTPVSSLNNPNISYPIARPTEDTKYILGGIASNGCRAFDTLHVIVDKRDNIFIPTAFSPNGDGKNDVLKITNLTFQRIQEFRIYNRYGQEVYSTNDVHAGWDGTYQGKPQGIGTYNYLIRVSYPDGFVETYKGETTLIR